MVSARPHRDASTPRAGARLGLKPWAVLILHLQAAPDVQAAPDERAVVAVLEIHDARKAGRLSKEEAEQAGTLLRAKLAELGAFKLVPVDVMRKGLAAVKANSMKPSFDESFQIAIGKEVAAQKTLAGEIISAGNGCSVIVTLFDLRTALAETAITESCACDRIGVTSGVEGVARRLAAAVTGGVHAGLSRPNEVAQLFALPQVQLAVVVALPTWSIPANGQRPLWETLRDKFGHNGLRIVVALPEDAECAELAKPSGPFAWADAIICDEDGTKSRALGLAEPPVAHVWSKSSGLLLQANAPAEVQASVDRFLKR
jgi:hypothetical protein